MGTEIEKRRPSGKWYILSAVLFVVSFGLMAYGFMGIFRPLYQEKQTFNIPTSDEAFTINDPGVYNVSYERPLSITDFMDKSLDIHIHLRPLNSKDENMHEVKLRRIGGDYTYTSSNACGQTLWDFKVDEPAELRISAYAKNYTDTSGEIDRKEVEKGRIAIEKEIGWKNMIMSMVTLTMGGFMFIGALAVFVTVLILQTTRKNPPPVV